MKETDFMTSFITRRLLVVVILTLVVGAPAARAESWTGTNGVLWADTGNWNPNSVPGSGGTAVFDSDGNSNTNISLGGAARPINTINFTSANAAAYNLGVLSSGDQCDIDANGAISVDSAVANLQTISAAIVTGGDLNITVANSSLPASNLGLTLKGGMTLNGFLNLAGTFTGALTIDAPITGPGILNSTITSGSLNLNAQSTYSGGTFFNATTTQPAIRLGVDTVGSPGAVTSGPLGTGTITTASGFPAVFQPVGGDRTIANEWIFTNAIFVGSVVSAPLADPIPHNLTLTGPITLGTTGRVLTNNQPAGVAFLLGSSTVQSNISLNNRLSFQTQANSGTDGGVTIINDPIVNGSSGTGAITVQNNAIVVMKNANNTYTGTTLMQGVAALPSPKLIVEGAITGGGNVVVGSSATTNGAILGGTGTVAPSLVAVARNSILSPGLRTLLAADNDFITNIGTFGTGPLAMRGGTTYYFQLNSSGTPAADLLNVDGTLSLQCTVAACPGGTTAQVGAGPDTSGATLTVKDLAATSTALSLGTRFTLMSYSGAWDNTTFDGLANGASLTVGANTFSIKYDDASGGANGGLYSNYVTLTVVPGGIHGDFNSDGKVDAGDYATWRKNDGTNNALANDNGLGTPVGPAHYDLWRTNFGKPPGSGSSNNGLGGGAVPEPASAALLVIACAAFAATRRRERRA
jgi:hypothetical protein